LTNNEYGNKDYQKSTGLSIQLFICSVETEEKHISKVLNVIEVAHSVNGQKEQGENVNVLKKVENEFP